MPVKKQPSNRAVQDIDKFIGARIRAARVTANMNQAELGFALNVSFQQVQKYEKGMNRVSVGRLQQIARALGRSPQWFTDEPATKAAKEVDDIGTRLCATSMGVELATHFLSIPRGGLQRQLVDLAATIAKVA